MSRDVPVQLPPELHSAPRGVLEVGACILALFTRRSLGRSCRSNCSSLLAVIQAYEELQERDSKRKATPQVLLHLPWMLQAFESGLLGP